ncbi:MAG TPA: hypothetical protein VHC19_20220 [Pirellulales bacterium]|nr:hypothetical protein [Pirellulales bacterium]
MKYVIEIPDDIEQSLERLATATGRDVAHLIQMAVVSFVRTDAEASSGGRSPDRPLEASEITAPCDLPGTAPRPIATPNASRRQPDPIADWE